MTKSLIIVPVLEPDPPVKERHVKIRATRMNSDLQKPISLTYVFGS